MSQEINQENSFLKKDQNSNSYQLVQRVFLVAVGFSVAVLFSILIVGLNPILLVCTAFLAILTKPVYKAFLKFGVLVELKSKSLIKKFFFKFYQSHFKNFKEPVQAYPGIENKFQTVSAILTILTTTLVMIGLLSLIITMFIQDVPKVKIDLNVNLETIAKSPDLEKFLAIPMGEERAKKVIDENYNSFKNQIQSIQQLNFDGISSPDFNQRASDVAFRIVNYLLTFAGSLIFNFIIMAIAWFFLLTDGGKLLKIFYNLSPFTPDEQVLINGYVQNAVRNVILGNITSGLSNAIAVYFLTSAFNIPFGFLMTIIAFFVGFLPLTPSEIAFIGPVGYLFAQNQVSAAIWVIILAESLILITNYVVLPKIIGGKSVHPFFILAAAFMAIATIGIIGFIIGPVCVFLMVALYKVYVQRKENIINT